MTQLERSFLYRADWAWQRTEEGILTLRYYWWCVQAMILVLVSIYRRYGLVPAINGASVSSRHTGRHGWETTPDEPVSAVALILAMRQEHANRERARWLTSFDSPPVPDGYYAIEQPRVTPLNDRVDYWFTSAPILELESAIVDQMDDKELDEKWEQFMERESA